jgi:two-component system sensor histidine kinase VicK
VEHHIRREYEGLGLGLAIARELVQIHHGRIWAESEEGEGSVFHVALPLVV